MYGDFVVITGIFPVTYRRGSIYVRSDGTYNHCMYKRNFVQGFDISVNRYDSIYVPRCICAVGEPIS